MEGGAGRADRLYPMGMTRGLGVRRADGACVAVATVLTLSLSACITAPVDPTTNVPIRATERRGGDEQPPAALSTPSTGVPVDERAPHTAMRIVISPLSRVERMANAPTLIDVRLDAFDSSAKPASMAGDLRIVLKSTGEPGFLAFDVPLATKRQVARRIDGTLEQFVLRLEPDWRVEPIRGSDLELTATLLTADGGVLESSARLRW